MDLIDLNKLHIESKYVKPKLSPIDINIINDVENPESILLPIFKAVYTNDFVVIKDYIESDYVEMNLSFQTPLMLAARLNNYKMVKLLLGESCIVDSNEKKALDYANEFNSSIEIIDLLSQREF